MNGSDAIGGAMPGARGDLVAGWQMRQRLTLLLVGLIFVAPFVIPVHRPPQPVFDMEWLAAVLLAGLAIVIGTVRSSQVQMNWPLPAWLAAMVAVAGVQQVLGRLAYTTQLVYAVLYGFAIFGAYFAGRALLAKGLRRETINTVAVVLIVGALLSITVQLLQLYGVKGLPWWLYFEVPDQWYRTRPFGNLGQANLLATYLVWSLLAVLYLHQRGMRSWLGVALFFAMAVGLALTRSRLGFVLSLLVIAGVWLPWALRAARLRDRWALTLALVLGYVVGTTVVSYLVAYQGAGVDTALQRFGERGSLAIRLVLWTDALKVSLTAPWLGTGFAGYALAQYWVAQADPYLLATSYAHNLVLDMAATLGWPMAIALSLIGCWWAFAQWRQRVAQPETAFAWAFMCAIGLHSLLEWPLASMNFAIPTALLFALTEPALPRRLAATFAVEARMLALAGVAGALLAVPMKLEFDDLCDLTLRTDAERRTEQGLSDVTLTRLLGLAGATTLRPYSDSLLTSLRSYEAMEATDEEIRRHERLLIFGAEPRLITRIIILDARAGRFDEALRHAERLRVFDRGEYAQLRDRILQQVESLGPDADPLRDYLRDYVPPVRDK